MTLPGPSQWAPTLSDYPDWYPGQAEAFKSILTWLQSPTRFMCIEAPTGSGKSLLAMLSALLTSRRTVILTATKGLQDQFGQLFGDNLADIRGQQSYICNLDGPRVTVDKALCHKGYKCPLQQNGCDYYDSLHRAQASPVVVTNYHYYLAQLIAPLRRSLGPVGMIICDEAHLAMASMQSHLECSLPLDYDPPTAPKEWGDWTSWLALYTRSTHNSLDELEDEMSGYKAERTRVPTSLYQRRDTLRGILRSLTKLQANYSDDWVWDIGPGSVKFTPVWPKGELLFEDTPKVLLMSAVLTPHLADTLRVPADDREFVSIPSSYPPANTPVTHVPTVRVTHRTSDIEMAAWVRRIDQIIEGRSDRKGIVSTVSYARRDFLLQHSAYADRMMTHDSRDTAAVVRRFRDASAPAVLVSPAITSGWDFPHDDCQYIIVGKVPYPDTRTGVTQARHATDKDWTSHLAMQTLIQVAGRGTRSESDQCEVLIVDDSWKWWWPKYRDFAPLWFQARVTPSSNTVPEPLSIKG